MNKLVRAAQTSQSLSLAAMEEASRFGLHEADIEHILLALVINEQSGGRALRSVGIDLDKARRAVEEQHDSQLASLGIDASFPEPGRIVFHETNGYQWSKRASDLLARASGKNKSGDAAAVLRELIAEPSGLIESLLNRLGTTPDTLLKRLDQFAIPGSERTSVTVTKKGRGSATRQTFVSAPLNEVWDFLTDPTRVPEWEMSVGTIDLGDQDVTVGTIRHGLARTHRPDGKPLSTKPKYRRRSVELVAAERSEYIAWRFTYPDAPASHAVLTEFLLEPTVGGTTIAITMSWDRHRGWRALVGLPLRPLQKFLLWFTLFHVGSAIGRAFR